MGRTNRKQISESSVLITGTVRDCSSTLHPTIEALARATKGFASTSYFIVESDSKDDTVDQLTDLSGRDDFAFVSLGKLSRDIPLRTERLAHCRNRVVEEVRKRRDEIDFVIVADFDGPNVSLSRKAIEDGWDRKEDWAVLTANQRGPYYDIWALRHEDWCPADCWRLAERLEPLMGRQAARAIAVYSRQQTLAKHAPLIAVESAFGGLGLYSAEAFCSGTYVGTADGKEVCEHVAFHGDLRRAGHEIYINPALLNEGPDEHIGARKGGNLTAVTQALRTTLKRWR